MSGFISLDALATTLELPKRYLRALAEIGFIPALKIGGRWRFNDLQVIETLKKIAIAAAEQRLRDDDPKTRKPI